MTPLEKYQKLQRQLKVLKTEEDQCSGAIKTLTNRLKEFGCKDLNEAKRKVKELNKKEKLYERKFLSSLKRFEDRYNLPEKESKHLFE